MWGWKLQQNQFKFVRGNNLKTTDGVGWKIITGARLLNSPVYILLVFSASQRRRERKCT